jgi:Chitin binding Peritrophin-A domain
MCVTSNGGGGGGGGFNCPRPGLFPDPLDCRRYFFCDGNRQSQHINCPTGTYFNTIVLGCVRGYC